MPWRSRSQEGFGGLQGALRAADILEILDIAVIISLHVVDVVVAVDLLQFSTSLSYVDVHAMVSPPHVHPKEKLTKPWGGPSGELPDGHGQDQDLWSSRQGDGCSSVDGNGYETLTRFKQCPRHYQGVQHQR